MGERWLGARVRRREDKRLVTGRGQFVADGTGRRCARRLRTRAQSMPLTAPITARTAVEVRGRGPRVCDEADAPMAVAYKVSSPEGKWSA